MRRILHLFTFLISLIVFSQQPYYSNVDLTKSGLALKTELSNKITTTHTNVLTYDHAREALKIIDLVPFSSTHVYLIYGFSNNTCPTSTSDDKDHKTRLSTSFGGGNSCEWNREHTYAQSLGVPALGQVGPGADVHHLRASDVDRNAERGNLKFIDGDGNSKIVSTGWYPGDEWKGDIARMMMYMYVRYGNQCLPSNVTIGSANVIDAPMINLLLEWNAEDPVSPYEDYRNEYLSNSSNTYYQGNRNPFIDNPYLATKIWGGVAAQDRWNTAPDTETPTIPTNLIASNITNTTVTLNWTASTDNSGYVIYEILKDDITHVSTTNTMYNITNLTQNTSYTFKVRAKDIVGNISANSNTVNVTTTNIIDTEAPTAPTNLTATNIGSTSTTLTWTIATDNIGVIGYDVFKDGILLATTTANTFNVTGLTPETLYNFTVKAKDAAGNVSEVSNTVSVTTLVTATGASDLFISEYIEGTSNNKAIEIANYTGNSINLGLYSIKKQVNGAGSWVNELVLSGTLNNQSVYVIANSIANSTILALAQRTSGAPIDFNGNDPVGLFKNGILIDIVGVFNGGSTDFAANTTLRRKSTITSPNTTYSTIEWDSYSVDTINGLGNHAITLSVNEYLNSKFNIYPNPTSNQSIYITIEAAIQVKKIEVMQLTGKIIKSFENPTIENNTIKISNLPSGFYILKMETDQGTAHKKIIVN